MADLPHDGLAVAVEIGRIAADSRRPPDWTDELLEQLHRLVPFDGASLSVADPDGGRFTQLVLSGYDSAILDFRQGPVFAAEVAAVGMDRPRPPMCLRDCPIPPSEVRGWVEYLEPAGFREGVGTGLFTSDGRYLGLLNLHTESPAHPTDAARDFIGTLAPLIAQAVDPMRTISALARVVGDAEQGIVVRRGGATMPLPGLPGHALLVAGSTLLAVAAARMAGGRTSLSFVWPLADVVGGYRRVAVLRAPRVPPYQLSAVVLLSPPGDLRGLTRRELEIAGLLVAGWPNPRIANALFIAERTVAAHVEHILTKLGVATRTAAAVYAVQLGLYIPSQPSLD